MDGTLLLLQIIGATIWTGGHIILSIMLLPQALKHRCPERLFELESIYEKIAIPTLIVQVVTGVMLARR